MKWVILGVILFIGIFILLFSIAIKPVEQALADQAIIVMNSTLGANVVANNFTGVTQSVRWLPWVAILTVAGCIGIAAYVQIKKR
jgi:flagellar motor component MotA